MTRRALVNKNHTPQKLLKNDNFHEDEFNAMFCCWA